MKIIGIDPGKNGGIGVIDNGDASAYKLPATPRDRWGLISSLSVDDPFALIERSTSSPQMGVKSAFTFGEGYGSLIAMLIAAGIPHDTVTPNKWMASLNCRTGGDKNVTKAKAQALFPNLRITHSIADAILIAEYARRLKSGELSSK